MLAVLAGDIEFIFNIVGAICSTTICFLFPYYFYFTITKKFNRKKGFVYYYTIVAFIILAPYAIFSIVVKNL
jgi:membrane protein DedA with SNARE-associated domain